MVSVYGLPPMTPEEREEHEQKIYKYLKLLIEAELICPETDYDGDGREKLLAKVAVSDSSLSRRESLIELLENKNE